MDAQGLFLQLYSAGTEAEVDSVLQKHLDIFNDPSNWTPLGGDEHMFAIVRNQQSNPIAALVEKITNSIDAILLRKCWEEGIDPNGDDAPRSMEDAITKFFPDHKEWDLQTFRRKQAEEIQIVADGPPRDTSVIIYDNGEGQRPEDFEQTFLSLVRGNKVNIHFVQGKYNMGGSGALVFCGKKRYQLIASKRFDGKGDFGWTLVRQHKIGQRAGEKRYSFFEYLKIDGTIPSFDSDDMDLKLYGRRFRTGTVIKLYSYQFPTGYYGFAQDLNQSFNEFLFEPVLPLLTVDKKDRYPNNKVFELDLFGLKRRLEEERNAYVETFFSEEYDESLFGKAKVTCYVFRPKLEGRDVKKSKKVVRDRFFKNNMSVLFSVNGQVHGSYTSEFITRTLKFNLLKDYLLIHVDCTQMHPDFREELFMASRDRLKQGEESQMLRDFLGRKLRTSQLEDINRHRKESIGLESEDTAELLKSFAKNLPKDSELFKLLQATLKLEEFQEKGKAQQKRHRSQREEKPFHPQRFPSLFQLHGRKDGANLIKLPLNGEKTIRFDTDVDDDYFDRVEENGELLLALLKVKWNDRSNGNQPGQEKEITDLLNVVKSSPNRGTIRLSLNPRDELQVGDELEVEAALTTPGEPLAEILLVRITEPKSPKEPTPKKTDLPENMGLPELRRLNQHEWSQFENVKGIPMDHDTVMYPEAEGDKIERIYINLDSRVFLNHRSKMKSEEQIIVAQQKYIASVYFHTLFLYMITKRRGYNLSTQRNGKSEDITVDEYIRDVFDNYYSDFLLNFGMEELMNVLE